MIQNFNNFTNEELRLDKLDDKSLNQLKLNLVDRLSEYRTYILNNIVYNMVTNKVEYKEFENIDILTILRELNNEFTDEVVQDMNIEAFLRKLNQILDIKKRNTKSRIR